jgi:CspA family cold shock protein
MSICHLRQKTRRTSVLQRTIQIAWFNKSKGFGFIEREAGPDVFCHSSSIEMAGYKFLEDGEAISFDILEGEKGPQAADVTRVRKDSPRSCLCGKFRQLFRFTNGVMHHIGGEERSLSIFECDHDTAIYSLYVCNWSTWLSFHFSTICPQAIYGWTFCLQLLRAASWASVRPCGGYLPASFIFRSS